MVRPPKCGRIADGLGLTITIYQPFRDFEAMPEPQRARNLERAERKFDVMQALGTDLVLVCSNTQAAAIDDDARAAADLAEMAERARRRGLRVGYEALAWGRHVNRWRHAWNIVRSANHDSLGLILDSFHTLAVGDDPFRHRRIARRADLFRATWPTHRAWRWTRCPGAVTSANFPGQGQLPVADFLRAVLAAGYRGPLSLEVFNDEFRAAPARMIARDGLRSLLLWRPKPGQRSCRRRRHSTASSSSNSRWTKRPRVGWVSICAARD